MCIFKDVWIGQLLFEKIIPKPGFIHFHEAIETQKNRRMSLLFLLSNVCYSFGKVCNKLVLWIHFSLKLKIVIASEPFKAIFLRKIMLPPLCKIMSEEQNNFQHSWICEAICTILNQTTLNSICVQ